jgi:hypothetical protein
MSAKLIEPAFASRVLAWMKITHPDDAALLVAIVRNAIAEHTDGGVISTATILAVVKCQAADGVSRNDVIAVIVREAEAGYAISFDHEDEIRG